MKKDTAIDIEQKVRAMEPGDTLYVRTLSGAIITTEFHMVRKNPCGPDTVVFYSFSGREFCYFEDIVESKEDA